MRTQRSTFVAAALFVATSSFTTASMAQTAAPPTAPQATPAPTRVELTTLRILRDKSIITQAEYDAALRDLAETSGLRAADATSIVAGKWSTTFYGFIEADQIYDSTQSFNDLAGNAQVQRPGPVALPSGGTHYAADHGRMMFSIRNSRFGFRLRAPEVSEVRTSAQLELDLLGNQPGTPPAVSESSYFASPTVRVRHAALRIETPVVDILIGQYWNLFGWQSVYHPNTVDIQGVPGQLYGRTPQVRISKTVHAGDFTFEAAIAAVRPPQRDSETPEGQAGMRFAFEKWAAMNTSGAAGTSIMPLSIAVTGDFRHYGLPEFTQLPTKEVEKTTTAIAIDAFLPVIPATKEKKGNSLALNGEFVTGYGMADQYTGLTGGIGNPSIPNTARVNPPPTYPSNIDPGLVVFDTSGQPHGVQWTTYLIGLQYYLPGLDGRVWISGNYSHTQSSNTKSYVLYTALTNPADSNYVSATAVRESEDWFDVNLFADVANGVRLGAEYANFNDRYTDGIHAVNHRVQMSGLFLF